MAASKPILGVLESGSEVRCLIEDTHGGLCCEPGEYDKVEENIRWFIENAGNSELEAFQKHPQIDAIEVVCLDGWHDVLRAYAKQFGISKLENVVSGGKNGQDSIRNGLYDIAERYKNDDDVVLIHDAIRPMVSADVITDNIRVCRQYGNGRLRGKYR